MRRFFRLRGYWNNTHRFIALRDVLANQKYVQVDTTDFRHTAGQKGSCRDIFMRIRDYTTTQKSYPGGGFVL